MKKSQSITLTFATAVSMAIAHAQPPANPPQDCVSIRRAAQQAGTPVPSDCAERHSHWFGGFGATARGHHHGGG